MLLIYIETIASLFTIFSCGDCVTICKVCFNLRDINESLIVPRRFNNDDLDITAIWFKGTHCVNSL